MTVHVSMRFISQCPLIGTDERLQLTGTGSAQDEQMRAARASLSIHVLRLQIKTVTYAASASHPLFSLFSLCVLLIVSSVYQQRLSSVCSVFPTAQSCKNPLIAPPTFMTSSKKVS
jgi:hypothetical protein